MQTGSIIPPKLTSMLLFVFPSLFPAVVLLNSKETQAELGWTSYPPNGVSVLTCIFHCLYVCLYMCLFTGSAPPHSCLPDSWLGPPLFIPPVLLLFFLTHLSLPLSHLLFSPSPQLIIIINRWCLCRLGYCSVQTSRTDTLPQINGPPPYRSICLLKTFELSYDCKTKAGALFKESATAGAVCHPRPTWRLAQDVDYINSSVHICTV